MLVADACFSAPVQWPHWDSNLGPADQKSDPAGKWDLARFDGAVAARSVDVLLFRHHFWPRLTVNVGIVLTLLQVPGCPIEAGGHQDSQRESGYWCDDYCCQHAGYTMSTGIWFMRLRVMRPGTAGTALWRVPDRRGVGTEPSRRPGAGRDADRVQNEMI